MERRQIKTSERPSSDDDDARLIHGFLVGERDALELVDRWIGVVLGREFRSLAKHWEDLRQEVRLRMIRNLGRSSFEGRSALHTYVHSVTRNVCIDFTRLAYRRREASVTELPSSAARALTDEADRHAHRDLLGRIFEGLSEADRTLISLVLVENFSYEETAKRLGVPEGTIKSRVSRCKERIVARYRSMAGAKESSR